MNPLLRFFTAFFHYCSGWSDGSLVGEECAFKHGDRAVPSLKTVALPTYNPLGSSSEFSRSSVEPIDSGLTRSDEHLDDDVLAMIEDPADDPETLVEKEDRRSIVQNCLAQHSPTHREVLDLVYYHEKLCGYCASGPWHRGAVGMSLLGSKEDST